MRNAIVLSFVFNVVVTFPLCVVVVHHFLMVSQVAFATLMSFESLTMSDVENAWSQHFIQTNEYVGRIRDERETQPSVMAIALFVFAIFGWAAVINFVVHKTNLSRFTPFQAPEQIRLRQTAGLGAKSYRFLLGGQTFVNPFRGGIVLSPTTYRISLTNPRDFKDIVQHEIIHFAALDPFFFAVSKALKWLLAVPLLFFAMTIIIGLPFEANIGFAWLIILFLGPALVLLVDYWGASFYLQNEIFAGDLRPRNRTSCSLVLGLTIFFLYMASSFTSQHDDNGFNFWVAVFVAVGGLMLPHKISHLGAVFFGYCLLMFIQKMVTFYMAANIFELMEVLVPLAEHIEMAKKFEIYEYIYLGAIIFWFFQSCVIWLISSLNIFRVSF